MDELKELLNQLIDLELLNGFDAESTLAFFKNEFKNNPNLEEIKESLETHLLEVQYFHWRKTGEKESEGTDITFNHDCGESAARLDFSDWANLDETISFEKMLKLEKWYEESLI